MTNTEIIHQFFEAWQSGNKKAISAVMSEKVKWHFEGRHVLAGTRHGIDEVVELFDVMGCIMANSNPTIAKLVIAEQNNYVIECHHVVTNRDDSVNICHHISVLWTFENEKIISGRHFFADPVGADNFFNAISDLLNIKHF